jgi:hypothetical protein
MAMNHKRSLARDGGALRFLRTILVAAVLCPSSAFVRQMPSARSALRLHGSVAGSIILGENEKSSDGDESGGSSTKTRLSRPERKAQERANKHTKARRRKHNFADRQETLQGGGPGEGRYELHSTVVGSLNQNSTADDVVKAIKRAQNLQ